MCGFSRKMKVLAFDGLGELSNSSLAIERPAFQQITVSAQDHVNHRNLVDCFFIKIWKRGLSVAYANLLIVHKPLKAAA